MFLLTQDYTTHYHLLLVYCSGLLNGFPLSILEIVAGVVLLKLSADHVFPQFPPVATSGE